MSDTAGIPGTIAEGATPLRVDVVQLSDVGLVRSENQDYAILGAPERQISTGGRGSLMVVADGMGGHRGGATASRLAATTIRNDFTGAEMEDVTETLRSAMEHANATIFREAQSNPELRGMGTTCSALVIRGQNAFIAHVGDSRIYRVRGEQIEQLTQDHSLVASMVREGLLTTQEAEVHPRRNVLQRSMGVGEQVEVDVLPPIPVEPGDTFILCSDGLHGLVKQEEMRQVAALPIEEAAREFVKRSIERGAPDNVTVIVARVEAGEVDSTLTAAKSDAEHITDKLPKPAKGKGGMFFWLLLAFLLAALFAAGFYLATNGAILARSAASSR